MAADFWRHDVAGHPGLAVMSSPVTRRMRAFDAAHGAALSRNPLKLGFRAPCTAGSHPASARRCRRANPDQI